MKDKRFSFASFFAGAGGADFLSAVIAVLIGLLVGLVIMLIANPSQAFAGFWAILSGGFSDMRNVGQILYFATPIIMTGLSVGFAGKTGLFNIGASGQLIVGAYAAIVVGVKCAFLPGPLHWMAALLAAMAAGALWGAVPGLLKARRNVHEVIACIMMNYIGMYLVNYLIKLKSVPFLYVHNPLTNQTQRVAQNAVLPKMGLDAVFQSQTTVNGITRTDISSVNSGILIAIAAGIALYYLLQKTKFGFELKAAGFNRDAARYAGINENRGIVTSMMIAGALAGLGGALIYLAGSGKGISVVDELAAEGFQGIPVALLGLNNPIGILFSGFFIALLTVSGSQMLLYQFTPEIIEIITSIIIYFSAFTLLLKGFLQQWLRGRQGKGAALNE